MSYWLKDNNIIAEKSKGDPLVYFPEFAAKKPKTAFGDVWWNWKEHNLRIQAIKDTIAELKAQADTNHINELYKHTPLS